MTSDINKNIKLTVASVHRVLTDGDTLSNNTNPTNVFYQLEYCYIAGWLSGLNPLSITGDIQQANTDKAARMLGTILGAPVQYSQLDPRFVRAPLLQSEIDNIIQRYDATLKFNRIEIGQDRVRFISDLHDIAKERTKTIDNTMILYQRYDDSDEWGGESDLYLINQLTGDAWLAYSYGEETRYSINHRHLCPVLCHASNQMLRDEELDIATNVPQEVIAQAMSHNPKTVGINHCDVGCNCEIEWNDDWDEDEDEGELKCERTTIWTPLLIVRDLNVIPLPTLNNANTNLNAQEVLYMCGIGGLANWAYWDCKALLNGLDDEDEYILEYEDGNHFNNYDIILSSGLVASCLAQRGSPNLVDCKTYFTASLFRQSHIHLTIYMTKLLCESMSGPEVDDEDVGCHYINSATVEPISDIIDAHLSIPESTLKQSLVGLLMTATDISLLPNNLDSDTVLFETPDVDSDIKVNSFLLTGNMRGKAEIWRCPISIEVCGHHFKNNLNRFIQHLTPTQIVTILYNISQIGFDRHGVINISDPFAFEYRTQYNGKKALFKKNTNLGNGELMWDTLNFSHPLMWLKHELGIDIPLLNEPLQRVIHDPTMSPMGLRLALTKSIDVATSDIEAIPGFIENLRGKMLETCDNIDIREVEDALSRHCIEIDGAWTVDAEDELPLGFITHLKSHFLLEYEMTIENSQVTPFS